MHNIKQTLTTLALAMICFIGIGSLESASAATYVEGDVWIGTDGNQMTAEEAGYWNFGLTGDGWGITSYSGPIVDGKIVGCIPAIVNGKEVKSISETLKGNKSLLIAPELPSSLKTLAYAFKGCSNLTKAPVIPNGVTNLSYTFEGCTSLTTAPEIPSSVISMIGTFDGCTGITTAPEIPNSVTNMYGTFAGCSGLTAAPVIPNGVTNMENTFSSCSRLTAAPEIPGSVTNMKSTFSTCRALTGEIFIPDSVTSMSGAFISTSKPITVVYTSNNTAVPAESFPSNVTLRLIDEGSGDPDPGNTDPDPGNTDPDPGNTDPDPGTTNPDPGEGTGGTPDPNPITPTTGLPVENGKASGNMAVYGNVEPIIMIDVVVPVTGIQFTINADRTIGKIDAEIVSNSPSPIDVYVISASAASLSEAESSIYNIGGAPTLVADDTFEDWNNLSKAQTKANIAISINGHNICTASSTSPIKICEIESAYGEDASGNFQANTQRVPITESILYGKGWDNSVDLAFKYDTVLEFAIP